MRDGVAVAPMTLDHVAQVRILVPQPLGNPLSIMERGFYF